MNIHFTNSQEVLTEFGNIKDNVSWFGRYQATITVKITDNEGYHLQPRNYTFSTLNLCNIFENLLQQLPNLKG